MAREDPSENLEDQSELRVDLLEQPVDPSVRLAALSEQPVDPLVLREVRSEPLAARSVEGDPFPHACRLVQLVPRLEAVRLVMRYLLAVTARPFPLQSHDWVAWAIAT